MAKQKEKEKITKEYKCEYCGNKFIQTVRKSMGMAGYGSKPKNNTSSQVQCKRCKNFLKTWDEGIEIESDINTKPSNK